MTADGPSANAIDWHNTIGTSGTIVAQDGAGATDDAFRAGSREQIPGKWGFTPSPSSPKDDIFFTAYDSDAHPDGVFLNLGSILKAANGAFDESFELNQLSPGTLSKPTYRTADVGGTLIAVPARKTGDVLLAFDTTTGGAVRIGVCRWASDQPDPIPGDPYPAGYFDSGRWNLLNGTALDDTNDKACTQINPTTAPTAEGAINGSTIPAVDDPISNADITLGNFGELSVNITQALTTTQNPNPCFHFESTWTRTRSSNLVNSDPEDVSLPKPIVVANCAASNTTPPITSATLSPAVPNGANAWYTSEVHVTVSATDPDDAVVETRCVLDPATGPVDFEALPTNCPYLGAGSGVSSDGQHTVYFASIDSNANGESVKTASFKIDATPPATIIRGAPTQILLLGAPVTGTARDNLSGISSTSVSFINLFTGRSTTRQATCASGCGSTVTTWHVTTKGLHGPYRVIASSLDTAANTASAANSITALIL